MLIDVISLKNYCYVMQVIESALLDTFIRAKSHAHLSYVKKTRLASRKIFGKYLFSIRQVVRLSSKMM